MRTIRAILAAILIAASILLPEASATSATTDQSDVWIVQGENGWGFQIVQRGSVIFVTMYVYDPTKAPIYYTATLFYAGNFVWTGDLQLTNGSWFGAVPWNPNALSYRKVGSMTWTATTVTTGQLKYDVDGVFVMKDATRLTLVYDDFSGHFAGGIHQTRTGCLNPSFNGTVEDLGILDIAQNGQSIAMGTFPSTGGSCAYTGTLSQFGQMGAVNGNYACSSGETGSFQTFEMQINPVAVTGRFFANSANVPGCQSTGYFGGMRVTTF